MQRGTRQTTKTASSDAHGNANSGVRFDAPESPGDASPPGIQFTRGSFSNYLLPLESPSSSRDAMPSRVNAAATSTASTPSELRSPSRKRPPPKPSAASPPPPTIASRAATASSILTPKRPSPPPAARGRGEATTVKRALTPTPAPPPPPTADTTAIDLSVINPVDALVKKLRQQANELTQVYELMETKDAELENLNKEIQQLQVRAEMQRRRPRTSMGPSVPRSIAKKPLGAAARQTMKATRILNPPLSPEKQQADDTAAAVRHMEEALAELRQCHHELLGQYSLSTESGSTAVPPADVHREQQLYIRVLEEAVHLKASELCITGHEELLVVLGELRHTIYQQEQAIGELQQEITTVKSESLECKTVRLELEDTLAKERSEKEHDSAAMRQREAMLRRQLEDTQRLAHTEHRRFQDERTTQDEQAKRTASLEKELETRTQAVRQWETTRSESWAKKEAQMVKQIEEYKASLEAERTAALRSTEALDKAQRQVDELKVMQEGLLQSIDQFVSKEDRFERQIKQLETEVVGVETLRQEKEALQASNDQVHEELVDAKRLQAEQQHNLAMVDAIKQTNDMIKAAIEATPIEVNPGSEEKDYQCELFSAMDVWIRALRLVLPSGSTSHPWLATLVEDLTACSTQTRQVLQECKEECQQLKQSNSVLEEACATGTNELKRFQAELLQAQTELIQSQLETEKIQFYVAAMEEEARDAQAQLHLRETLATQIFEQENLLKTQQQRFQYALDQNHEFVAREAQLTDQLTAREHELSHMRQRLLDDEQQQRVLCELEHELEEAATLAERQNAWNQQLTVELEHLELTNAELDQRVETLATKDKAVTSRVSTLFAQYKQFVVANKQRLHAEYAIGNGRQGNQAAAVSVHDEAQESDDVLLMLRVFPTLVEEYLASVMLGMQSSHHQKDHGKRADRVKQRALAPSPPRSPRRMLRKSDVAEEHDKPRRPTKPDASAFIHPDDDDDELLDTQLRKVARAFHQFKSL